MSNNEKQLSVVPQQGAVVRQSTSGESELEVRRDMNVAAVAATAEATVKAKFSLAQYRQRDIEVVRQRLLKDCKRPGFAEKAMYAKPQGTGTVTGLSIRFAEAAFRHMGNLDVKACVIAEDHQQRVVEVSVMDLETNATDSQQVVIAKTTERRADKAGNPPANRVVIEARLNTSGDKLFVLEATEDEMLTKTNSLVARIRRNKILEMLPVDLKEEAIATIAATAKAQVKADPDAAKRKMLDSFAAIGIGPEKIAAWLEHPLTTVTADELDELRGIWNALDEGQTTWAKVMGDAEPDATVKSAPPPPPPKQAPTESAPVSVTSPPPDDGLTPAERAELAKLPSSSPPKAQPASGSTTPAKVDPRAKPPEGTPEHAEWLIWSFSQAKTMAELGAIAAGKVHPEWTRQVDQAYAATKKLLKGGAA